MKQVVEENHFNNLHHQARGKKTCCAAFTVRVPLEICAILSREPHETPQRVYFVLIHPLRSLDCALYYLQYNSKSPERHKAQYSLGFTNFPCERQMWLQLEIARRTFSQRAAPMHNAKHLQHVFFFYVQDHRKKKTSLQTVQNPVHKKQSYYIFHCLYE